MKRDYNYLIGNKHAAGVSRMKPIAVLVGIYCIIRITILINRIRKGKP